MNTRHKNPDLKLFALYVDKNLIRKVDLVAKRQNVTRSKQISLILEAYLEAHR